MIDSILTIVKYVSMVGDLFLPFVVVFAAMMIWRGPRKNIDQVYLLGKVTVFSGTPEEIWKWFFDNPMSSDHWVYITKERRSEQAVTYLRRHSSDRK